MRCWDILTQNIIFGAFAFEWSWKNVRMCIWHIWEREKERDWEIIQIYMCNICSVFVCLFYSLQQSQCVFHQQIISCLIFVVVFSLQFLYIKWTQRNTVKKKKLIRPPISVSRLKKFESKIAENGKIICASEKNLYQETTNKYINFSKIWTKNIESLC